MATEQILVTAGLATTAYVAKQLFGKTLAEMGDDLNKVYKANRDKLLEKAAQKVTDPNDGAQANLRVARDVIWNGSVTDDEVCAEYFGGLLAASRTVDGKDDSALIYVDCIKALSSKQLHFHFVIYDGLQDQLIKAAKTINPGLQDEVSVLEVWFSTLELERLGLRPDIDLSVLFRQGLISGFVKNTHTVGEKMLPYVKVNPTTFGILLYAAALNSLDTWRMYSNSKFAQSSEIKVPFLKASTLEELCALAGLTPQPPAGSEIPAPAI